MASLPDEEEQREVDLQDFIYTTVLGIDPDELEAMIGSLVHNLAERQGPLLLLSYNPLRALTGSTYLLEVVKEIGESYYGEPEHPEQIIGDLEALAALSKEYNPPVHADVVSRLGDIERVYNSLILMLLEPSLRNHALPLDQETMSKLLDKYAQKKASYFVPLSTGGIILQVEPYVTPALHIPGYSYPLMGMSVFAVTATEEQNTEYLKICEARGVTFEAEGCTYMVYSPEAMMHRWKIKLDEAYLSEQGIGRENAFISWRESTPHLASNYEVIVVDPKSKRRVRSIVYEVRKDESGGFLSEMVAQRVYEYRNSPVFSDPEEPSIYQEEWIYVHNEGTGWEPVQCVWRHIAIGGVDLMVTRRISSESLFIAVMDEFGKTVMLAENTFQLFDGEHTIAFCTEQNGYMVPVNIRTPVTDQRSDEILEPRQAVGVLPKRFPY